MSLIRAVKSTGGSNYMGFCEVVWLGIRDRVDEKTDSGDVKFPWADVYLDVELKPRDSQYSRNMTICGSFDKDNSGKVKADSPLLKRIYWFLDSIDCQAGINAKGEWEDESGNTIEDIANFLRDYIKADSHNLFVFIYKEPDKKDPNKAWTRVHNHIVKNDTSGREELESYIAFMRQKGYLKEATNIPTKKDPDLIVVESDEEINDLLGMPE